MMRCFASYDCTGQQLLDSGTVVINGERSALDLQIAEGKESDFPGLGADRFIDA